MTALTATDVARLAPALEIALRYVTKRKNANGSARWYWQRKGHKTVRLPESRADRERIAGELNATADAAEGFTPQLPKGKEKRRRRHWRPPIMRPAGFIYAVQMGDGGPIKIGFSESAETLPKRLRALQTGCPHPIRVLATMPGRVPDERDAHQALAAHRLKGEWFSPAPEVLAFVTDMARRSHG
ncbi:MAG TPA: GIY-YIG nuclease family protein [Salinarimonas sp.]|nr:GIY-YIG nuclease family protein [Salinarimonas sp.]